MKVKQHERYIKNKTTQNIFEGYLKDIIKNKITKQRCI